MALRMHTKDGTSVPRAWALSVGPGPGAEPEFPGADFGPSDRSPSAAWKTFAKFQLAKPSTVYPPSSSFTLHARQEASGVRPGHRGRPIAKAGATVQRPSLSKSEACLTPPRFLRSPG